ncbi:putative glycoprotein [Beihai hermit crab virus 3]|uniref:Putative glycoprotein n=1 Tax=Beihai hermit crab virus 3 TaxID=1922390 RepID=A0A1L3KMP0_9VIRU|nr:putative glycoprotein [Beihai hermit crab virus 3]APG78633.1 putative glycoprotein [Beihai hermit crab virus 3]
MTMMIHSLLNLWLSLGMFQCGQRPFLPRDSHHTLALHLPLDPLFDTLTFYNRTLQRWGDWVETSSGITEFPRLMASWRILSSQVDNHLHTLKFLSDLDLHASVSGDYSPGHSLNISHPRSKRGLLDFVGDIQSKLWGTATTSQLDEVVGQIRGILKSSVQSGKHLQNVITLSNSRITSIEGELMNLARSVEDLTSLAAASERMAEEQGIVFIAFFKKLVANSEIRDLESFCLTLHEISQMSPGSPIGNLMIRLVADVLRNPHQTISYDALSTMTLSYLYIDHDDLIIGVHYASPSVSESDFTLLHLQPLSVGVLGQALMIPDLPTHLIISSKTVIGHLDPWCTQKAHTSQQLETCPVLPLPQNLSICINHLIQFEASNHCPLSLVSTPWPIQQTCTREWIIDSSRVSCPSIPHQKVSLILASFNYTEVCTIDGRPIILPATQSGLHVRHVSPLVFLLHNTTYSESSSGFHPHVISHSLMNLHSHLLEQTQNWTHLKGATDQEIQHYIELFSRDQSQSAEYLSNLTFRKYHVSLWDTLSPYLLWALSIYSGGLSTLLCLFFMCRPARAFPTKTVSEIHHDNALIVADWLMIVLLGILIFLKVRALIRKRQRVTLSSHSLVARGTVVEPGQMLVFLVIGVKSVGGQFCFIRVLIGGTFDANSDLTPSDTFRTWNITFLPPNYLRGRWSPLITVHHTGIFSSYNRILPIQNPLTIPLPPSVLVSERSVFSVAAIHTIHDLSD